MERLTFDGNFCDIAQCRNVPGGSFCEDGACSQKKVWERLKAYEDKRLEPEEVLPKDKADEIALKLMRLADLESLCNYTRLRELAEADKDGHVVVLPCKVGDTVYFALFGRIIEKQVFSIVSFSKSTRIYCGGTSEYFRPEDIGKTVFLTSEEAEKAMKGETEK
nr:MAG TPA: hypothetical protein [Caudoviricetes sp.]